MFARYCQLSRSVRASSARFASTIAFIEHSAQKPTPATLSAISAATKLGNPVTALIAGSNSAEVASHVAKLDGISKVLISKNSAFDHGMPETIAPLIVHTAKETEANYIVAPSSAESRDIIPRVSALLDTQPITDVVEIQSDNTFVRPIYAGNVLQTVKSKQPLNVLTVRSTAFAPTADGSSEASVEEVSLGSEPTPLAEFVSETLVKSERPDLGSASKVVSGGRGLKNKENFEKYMYPLADSLGAAVGASRAAVDSGFCDNSLQVGQTGKVVAPDLYLAVGISGAIQHLAGMKDSKVISAINKDEDAPIFHVADVGLVADLFEAVPEITKKLS